MIVSGRTLAHIARMLNQTIEGEFVALGDDAEAWLVIRAVDSSWFEVWSHRPLVLEQIKGHFHDTTDVRLGC